MSKLPFDVYQFSSKIRRRGTETHAQIPRAADFNNMNMNRIASRLYNYVELDILPRHSSAQTEGLNIFALYDTNPNVLTFQLRVKPTKQTYREKS